MSRETGTLDLAFGSAIPIVLFAITYLAYFTRHLSNESGTLLYLVAGVCTHFVVIFWLAFRRTTFLPKPERISDALTNALLSGFVFLIALMVVLIATLGV